MKATGWTGSLLLGSAVWLVVVGVILLELWPTRPRSVVAWGALVVLGPPLYVGANLLMERLWASRVGEAVSNSPSRTTRILIGVAIGVLWLGLLFAVTLAIGEPKSP